MIALIALVAVVHFGLLLYFRSKVQIPEYSVHIQGRTESDEHMDFAVNLFRGEPPHIWRDRLAKAFELKEERLAFQNNRMLADMESQKELLKKEKE